MRATPLLVGLVALLLPAAALASSSYGIDITGGAAKEMLGITMQMAWGFLPFATIVAILVEAAKSPSVQKDFLSVVWRVVIVLALLGAYPVVFGSVVRTSQAIAARLAPDSAYEDFRWAMSKKLEFLKATQEGEMDRESGGVVDKVGLALRHAGQLFGGVLFNLFMTFIILIGQLAHWVLTQVGAILASLFYILGPLALVWAIPRITGTGGKWFAAFVTYCTWPLYSGIIVRLVTAMGTLSLADRSSGGGVLMVSGVPMDQAVLLSAVAASAVLLVTAIAVPKVAGSIVSAAAGNFASQGLADFNHRARQAVAAASGGKAALAEGGKELAAIAKNPATGGVDVTRHQPGQVAMENFARAGIIFDTPPAPQNAGGAPVVPPPGAAPPPVVPQQSPDPFHRLPPPVPPGRAPAKASAQGVATIEEAPQKAQPRGDGTKADAPRSIPAEGYSIVEEAPQKAPPRSDGTRADAPRSMPAEAVPPPPSSAQPEPEDWKSAGRERAALLYTGAKLEAEGQFVRAMEQGREKSAVGWLDASRRLDELDPRPPDRQLQDEMKLLQQKGPPTSPKSS